MGNRGLCISPARLGVFKIATFFFLKNTSHAMVLFDLPRNPPMAKPAKKSLCPKAPAPEPARRVTPRRATAMEGDLQAMDRLIQLTGELDRYHGFGKSPVSRPPQAPQRSS
jgi:hypothetical protein